MKLNICYKEKQNILFSIEVKNNIDKESKIIVFAPNGVGKTSITNSFRKVYNMNLQDKNYFFIDYDEFNPYELDLRFFKENDYDDFIVTWSSFAKLLTKELKRISELERDWYFYKLVLGATSIISYRAKDFNLDLLKENSYKATRLLPCLLTLENKGFNYKCSDDEKRFNDFINKEFFLEENINKILKILQWYLNMIKDFVLTNKNDLQKHLETYKDEYEKKYRLELKSTYMFAKQHLSFKVLDSLKSKKNIDKYYGSWRYIIFIGKFLSFIKEKRAPYVLKEIDNFKKNIKEHISYLTCHINKVNEIRSNKESLRRKFEFSNWLLVENYEKEINDTKDKYIEQKQKETSIIYRLNECKQDEPFPNFKLQINNASTFSKGEQKFKLLVTCLEDWKESKKMPSLIVFDDPVTSLDYFNTSRFISWLRYFEKPFLILTHSFSFFAKFSNKNWDKVGKKVYFMDKLIKDNVFIIELKDIDYSFIDGEFWRFWQPENIDLDEIVFSMNIVYEILRSFYETIDNKSPFKSLIEYYIRGNKPKKIKKIKRSISNFMQEYKKLVNTINEKNNEKCILEDNHITSLVFIKKLNEFLNLSNSYKNLKEMFNEDIYEYILSWKEKRLEYYTDKINKKENSISFFEYLKMKYLLTQCFKLNYKLLSDAQKREPILKQYNDQIKSLIHFESLRFIPLLEISCETILEAINEIEKMKSKTNNVLNK